MPTSLQKQSLVLYKNGPALILSPGDKLEIELDSGKTIKVREKDVTLLHPGPLASLRHLTPPPGEVETAWELLAGQTTTLPELAELIFEEFTPATAWATWQLVADGLYFSGVPAEIIAHSPEQVEKTQADRDAKARDQRERADFMARVEAGQLLPDDGRFLTEVEAVALGQQDKSRLMRDLNQAQSQENAHRLLLSLGYWNETANPYPQRMGLPTAPPNVALPPLPEEPRRDLTHLPAFAIDDAGSTDPDDAISLDGDRLWVHIADVAALAPPNSPADIEARARGASLYLPEGVVTMLPPQATPLLALGLQEVSPALSFGLDVSAAGEVSLAEVTPSWVRVSRLSYEEAETRLADAPFSAFLELSNRFTAQRQRNGAIDLNLPEVKIRVEAGQVVIKPLPRLRSHDMVRDMMLLAGVGLARFAQANNIPLLYSTQDAPTEEEIFPDTLSGNFARRRTLQRSQLSGAPAPHAGLGLDMYAQTTSPLRRYADLVAHQQIRAWLKGEPLLTPAEVLERVGAAEAVAGSVRQTERLANKHWTLVYLQRQPDWQGEAVVVEQLHRKARLLIPQLDLETTLHAAQDLPLDSIVRLRVSGINLPELEAHVRLVN
ncbi:MAG: RNB domain-containing ribonuclease [Anaerolineae bacterium]